MNIWKTISYLGVTGDMPVNKQKSIILFNQIIRILALVFLFSSISMYFYWEFMPLAIFFIALVPFFAITLFLNLKGHVYVSIYLVSFILPLLFTFISGYTKSLGTAYSISFYVMPRISVLIVTLLPAVILGFAGLRKSLPAMSVGLLTLIFFDKIHELFGIYVKDIPYIPEHYHVLEGGVTGFFLLVVILIFFLQKINITYEKLLRQQKEETEKQRDIVITQRDKLVERNEEIRLQKEKIEKQNNKIVRQNKNITDSIYYAKRIQTALLPPQKQIESAFENHFIFFKPRDIVSGDFYWFKKLEYINKTIYVIAAADCTGHGVPGAFVSMLGMSFLNEISQNIQVHDTKNLAAHILEKLRQKVKTALHQSGKKGESKDGMDIALCVIDTETNSLQYSGAHNPLYLIREKGGEKINFDKTKIQEIDNFELIQIKADPMPIGIHLRERDFTNRQIKLFNNDKLYIFSDGFIDQTGGEKGKKFMSKNFKNLLLEVHNKPMNVQKSLLEQKLEHWKQKDEQVDDILVIGFRI